VSCLSFAQFGSDLDASTKSVIEHGARLTELLKQGQYSPMKLSHEVMTLFAAKHRFIKEVPVAKILDYQEYLLRELDQSHGALIDEIDALKAISPDLETKLKTAVEAITKQFLRLSVR
jgi:F-type H+/Na+-transporting ATPase subunit alpha